MTSLVQFIDGKNIRHVGIPSANGDHIFVVEGAQSVYELALEAIAQNIPLSDIVNSRRSRTSLDYEEIVAAKRLLPPVDHPDPCRTLVSGTGLTHLGSADVRDRMHKNASETDQAELTDSMKMFRWGIEQGRPPEGQIGIQPEWFYKGNGRYIVPPEQPLLAPPFAEDAGEEPELAFLYVIGPDGTPFRLGAALGNEFSDHVMERRNFLFLAHSKLRQSAFGPELLLGPPPPDVRGVSRLRRAGAIIWEKPFLTGEANMSHSLANLEHHHFKYPEHRIPGDLHVHYLGTATLSFADGIRAEPGDIFEIEADGFGRPLRNPLGTGAKEEQLVRVSPL